MRKAFVDELVLQAQDDPAIVLLTGDLGYSVVEPFQIRFPDRFFNIGVAEQNMVSVAGGLAKTGYKVVVYSIGNFLAFRALEQIRNDVYFPRADVLFVGVGSGLEYGAAGFTHWMTEDLAALSALESMPVYTPSNEISLVRHLRTWLNDGGPAYLRLGKRSFAPGEVEVRNGGICWVAFQGTDEAYLSYGNVGVELKDVMANNRAPKSLLIFEQLSPLDIEPMWQVLQSFASLTVIEDHIWFGGLASRLAHSAYLNGRTLSILWRGIEHAKLSLSTSTSRKTVVDLL